MKKALLPLLILLIIFNDLLYSQWYWQEPFPGGNELRCTKFINAQTGYAAGALGTIMKTTNGGSNWILQISNTQTLLASIDFIDANTGVAVGDSCIVVRTTNGGANWTKSRLIFSTGGFFSGIDFANDRIGYISGGIGFSQGSYVVKTFDAGQSWFQLNTGVTNTLYSVSFLDSLQGMCGGNGGRILRTSNGGVNWTQENLPTGSSFNAVSYIQQDTQYALRELVSYFKTTNNGANWIQYSLDLPNINGSGDITRFMAFSDVNTGYVVSSFGRIARTTNGGANFTTDFTYSAYGGFNISILLGISAIDDGIAVIVGSGGKLLRTTTSGANWSIQNGFKHDLHTNWFTDVNTGYSAGYGGRLIKTTNGGDNWFDLQSGTTQRINSIYFTSPNTGYIAADTGTILKTTNAGENWFAQSSGLTGQQININDIHFLNSNTGILGVDSGKILKTTNAGVNWNIKSLEVYDYIIAVWYLNPLVCIASSDGGIFRSTNGGENWFEQTLGPFGAGLDLFFSDSLNGLCVASINESYKTTNGGDNWLRILNTGRDAALYSVYSLNDSFSYAVGRDEFYGYIVKSTNGGLNWTRLPNFTSNSLNAIFFVNSNTGYISGQYGTLLKTTNGGMTFVNLNTTGIPEAISLHQNYPNPFNPKTKINYEVRTANFVSIKVFDVTGKEVVTLINENKSPGSYDVELNAVNLTSGIYFYSIFINGNLTDTKKCVLLK